MSQLSQSQVPRSFFKQMFGNLLTRNYRWKSQFHMQLLSQQHGWILSLMCPMQPHLQRLLWNQLPRMLNLCFRLESIRFDLCQEGWFRTIYYQVWCKIFQYHNCFNQPYNSFRHFMCNFGNIFHIQNTSFTHIGIHPNSFLLSLSEHPDVRNSPINIACFFLYNLHLSH